MNHKYAIATHGRVGGLHSRAGDLTHAGSQTIVQEFSRHLRSACGACDTFVHIWNPELEHTIIQTLNPKRVLSERVIYKDKALSQTVSMIKSVRLVADYEMQFNFTYEFVMSIRNDVILYDAIPFKGMHQDFLYVSSSCMQQSDACINQDLRLQYKIRKDVPWHFAINYFIPDRWLIGSSKVLLSWSLIEQEWSWYQRRYQQITGRTKESTENHYIWPIHIHEKLKFTNRVRFAYLSDRIFHDQDNKWIGGDYIYNCTSRVEPLSESRNVWLHSCPDFGIRKCNPCNFVNYVTF